jgi:hypothetical protein
VDTVLPVGEFERDCEVDTVAAALADPVLDTVGTCVPLLGEVRLLVATWLAVTLGDRVGDGVDVNTNEVVWLGVAASEPVAVIVRL